MFQVFVRHNTNTLNSNRNSFGSKNIFCKDRTVLDLHTLLLARCCYRRPLGYKRVNNIRNIHILNLGQYICRYQQHKFVYYPQGIH